MQLAVILNRFSEFKLQNVIKNFNCTFCRTPYVSLKDIWIFEIRLFEILKFVDDDVI
jgi:hypothetical protein